MDLIERYIIRQCSPWEVTEDALKRYLSPVRTIVAGKKVRGYDKFFETHIRRKRLKLVADTFLAYAAIVQAVTKGDRESLPALFGECEENYLKRADDLDFKYFGIEDGAARFNDQQVDFRLATLIKWAYRDYPKDLKKLDTIHKWTFG